MRNDVSLFLKGLAMGAANVVPGVSGGTIALISGIYERLINAIKSCDVTAARLVLGGRLRAAWDHIDGRFLLAVMLGVVVSILTLARLFDYLLQRHEQATMAFFFGLILLSIWYVSQRVSQWTMTAILALLIGTTIAVGIALLAPASENDAPMYVFLCGVIAISSMILPGLSGSFVLIIMGNYALVLGAINTLALPVLIPMALGCVFGLIVFSHILAWVFKRYEDATLALMTGFVVGSLVVIWPWKTTLTQEIARDGKPAKQVVVGYDWYLPPLTDATTLTGLLLIGAGAATIVIMEKLALGPPADTAASDDTAA